MQPIMQLVFLVVLVFIGVCSAAPSPRSPITRSFKFQRPNHVRTRNAQMAMKKSLGKYNMPMPIVVENAQPAQVRTVSAVAAADGSGETGEVQNNPTENDVEYVSAINIGGQDIVMDFDTGSSDLWVFSTDLPKSQQVGHTIFNPANSSTFSKIKGATWSISFGDSSSASGQQVGTDTVNIGGAVVENQAVELASRVSQSFVTDTASNGLVGLAFGKINTVVPTQQKTFFENIQSQLSKPVFTANLKHADTGSYEFGKIDPTSFTGEITYIPIDDSQGFWQFPSSLFAVGNGAVQKNIDNSPAIADTGTSLLLVDESVLQGYYTQVKGAVFDQNQGGVVFPCTAALPDLKIALGSKLATIPGDLLNFVSVGKRGGVEQCFGAMQSNQGQGIQIFGDVLFKAQFAVFNIADKTVGFAQHA